MLLLLACGRDKPDPGDDSAAPDSAAPDSAVEAGPWAHCRPGVPVALPATLSCAQGELSLQAYAGGAVRITGNTAALVERGWAIPEPPAPGEAFAARSEGALHLCTEALRVELDLASCAARVEDAEGALLLQDEAWETLGAGWRLRGELPVDARVHGLGGRSGGLDHQGRLRVFRNTDAYDGAWGGFAPEQDPPYTSIPLSMENRGGRFHGVFTDSTWTMSADLGASEPGVQVWEAEGGALDRWILPGPTPAAVLEAYSALTGRMAPPPRWALGFHQCRWGYADAARVLEVARGFRDLDIPADALWLDIQHMDGFRTFTFDPVNYADPAGLAAELEALGFRLVVISDPGIKVDPGWSVYDAALAEDLLLRRPDGQVFTGQAWPGESAWPDFSLPAARDWWAAEVEGLVGLGVDGIWLDVNEPTTFPEGGSGTTVDDAVRAHGEGQASTMAELHNAYALLEAQATWAGLAAGAPARRPFILSRAGSAGVQRHAALWTGDAPSTWTHLADTLPMLLNLGLSGVPMSGSDVGGYSGGASAELYARWMALGAASPFFRSHVTLGAEDQEPWAFGTEVRDLSRDLIRWRYALLPTWESLFIEASENGSPPLRPLLWADPEDPALWDVQDQAMIGDWLMIAPALVEGATTREVVLPEGRWLEWWSGAAYEGPATVEVDLRLASLPIFLRAGGLVATRDPAGSAPEGLADPLILELAPTEGAVPHSLVEEAGPGDAAAPERLRTAFVLSGDDMGASLVAARDSALGAGRQVELRFRRVDHAPESVHLDGVALTEGSDWWWDEADLSLRVRFAEPAAGWRVEARYDPTLVEAAPPVAVPLRVQVPEGTPTDAPVYVTHDADGWQMHALSWEDGVAVGSVTVPRGAWFEYKYTRGDWCSVEKWPECQEAENRYAFGSARLEKADVVYGWRDWCEACE
ncbi:MAG: alpha-glucosidase [Alphaproteobacteria bacterium]|nr:alpha-glucosidase [Alphaproteobacteria bacterium]